MNKELERAVKIASGPSAVARLIHTHRTNVHNWRHRQGSLIPMFDAIALQREMNGAVLAERLRPDLDWGKIRAMMKWFLET